MIPLVYVTRENNTLTAAMPNLDRGLPHSKYNGSVEEELVDIASNIHIKFRDDNSEVY